MPEHDRGVELAQIFSDIARVLQADRSVAQTLERIVELAVQTIDGCDWAGHSYIQGARITTPVATDDIPRQVDRIQQEVNEGPCLDSIRTHATYRTGDLAAETRWPLFATRTVAETGVRSVLSFRLFIDETTLGALNLYSGRTDAFDDDDVAVGTVFAAHAALALSSAVHEEQLAKALEGRDVIGQAKGILMAREGVTADGAFDILRRGSQRLNIKLRELAEQMTGTSDGPAAQGQPLATVGPDPAAGRADTSAAS